MKKLLLFFALVSVVCCLFVVIASAAEIPEWTEITIVEGMSDKSVFGADGTVGATSRVLMSDGKTYPAYYICNNSNSLGFKYTELNTKTGKSYGAVDVVRLEIPKGTVKTPQAVLKTENGYTSLLTADFPEGFTKMEGYTFKATETIPSALVSVSLPSTLTTVGLNEFVYCTCLEELTIPEGVTSIPKQFAYYATSLKKLTLPSTIISIGEQAFRSCDLSNGIIIPEGCTTISSHAFRGSGVTIATIPSTLKTLGINIFSECNSLTTLNSKSPIIGDYMFSSCAELKNVTLENTVEIKQRAFNNSDLSKIEVLVLPEGLTTIGDYALPRNSIKELVLPSTLTKIGQSAFYESKSLKRVVVLGTTIGKQMFSSCGALCELVLTENLTTIGASALDKVNQGSFITYYSGTDYARIKSLNSTTRFTEASYCTYEDYVNGNYTSKKFMFVYDCNVCVVAFNGIHTEPADDYNCTTSSSCLICKKLMVEALEHKNTTTIEYASFDKVGTKTVSCTNEGCNHKIVTQPSALFTFKGYSTPMNGKGEIVVGYSINKDAINEYSAITGKSINYGAFAALKSKLGNNSVFDDNGAPVAGSIAVDITGLEFVSFELKISGFITDDQRSLKLAMGTYVMVTDEETEYSYLQGGTPNDGESYYYVSYNDVVGMSQKEA